MPAPYDDVADWYDAVLRRGTIVQEAAVRLVHELAGDVAARHVCDLACGQGMVARALADRGASVVGVDISSKLLAIARADERNQARGIQYVEGDAEHLDCLLSSSLDGVVCNLALMDIGNLPAVSQAVHRVLRPGGWFVFTVMHPCFQTPDSKWVTEEGEAGLTVRAYFAEGFWRSEKAGMRYRVGAFHRTLSTYFNAFCDSGFVLRAVSEPRLGREPSVLEPAYDVVPAILGARFLKPA
jgi:ubiquinone/menaquinone biosynthesis C-methylase UbiE